MKNDSDVMRRVLILTVLGMLSFRAGAQSAGLREVSSAADLERLHGFANHFENDEKLERERISGVRELKKSQLEWERQMNLQFEQEKKQRKLAKDGIDESSVAYKQDLKEKELADRQHEKDRREYEAQKAKDRKIAQKVGTVSEERELGLEPDPARVAWDKRKFLPSIAGIGSSGGAPNVGSSPIRPTQPEIPPPPPSGEFSGGVPSIPPQEFMDAEPPPPPPFEPGANGFDDLAPPPIYDDGADFQSRSPTAPPVNTNIH